jgi:hypothetical protein
MLLGTILIIIAMVLAAVSALAATRPAWLLELAVFLGFLGVLLGPTILHLN